MVVPTATSLTGVNELLWPGVHSGESPSPAGATADLLFVRPITDKDVQDVVHKVQAGSERASDS
jgi:hypothetical protein